MQEKAVIVFSGGLDSTTVLYYAKNKGYELFPISFDYGQRHKKEIEIAAKTCLKLGIDHKIFTIDLSNFGGSALTSKDMELASYEDMSQVENKIYNSYVPARNTIFLSLALAYAETLGANHIFMGPNLDDYENYPDCRPDFYSKFAEMAKLGTKMGAEGKEIFIHTPLISMRKPEIIKLGISLGVDYSQTISCYNPLQEVQELDTNHSHVKENIILKSCGKCLSCTVRKNAFRIAGINDGAIYK
jgi:7-cyano-7-deazaguanine synthase